MSLYSIVHSFNVYLQPIQLKHLLKNSMSLLIKHYLQSIFSNKNLFEY